MNRSSQYFKEKDTTQHTEELEGRKLESPLKHYTVITTSCILICCVVFCFLVFQTNTFIDIDSTSVKHTLDSNTKVSSVVSGKQPQAPNIPGVSENPVGDGYYRYDTVVFEKLMSGANVPHGELNAKLMAALYLFLADEYGPIAVAGICGNIFAEGCPGLIGYYNNHPDWNGPGTGTVVSTGYNPVFVRNDYNIEHVANDLPFGGVGSMQFTSQNYRRAVAEYYKKYKQEGVDLTDDDLRAAEVDYIVNDIVPAFSGIKNCTTPSEAADWWLVNYEKPGFSHHQVRCDAAETVYALITGGN